MIYKYSLSQKYYWFPLIFNINMEVYRTANIIQNESFITLREDSFMLY